MGKIILEIILLVIILGGLVFVANYLLYFWINHRRRWKQEDEAFNAKKKQEALQDLMDTQKLLEEAKEDYIDNRAYKTDSVDKILEKR